jgi:hypothetical protein
LIAQQTPLATRFACEPRPARWRVTARRAHCLLYGSSQHLLEELWLLFPDALDLQQQQQQQQEEAGYALLQQAQCM